jgi:hypothetical protein
MQIPSSTAPTSNRVLPALSMLPAEFGDPRILSYTAREHVVKASHLLKRNFPENWSKKEENFLISRTSQ